MESNALTRNDLITQLTRSPHGKLIEYATVGIKAAQEDPEFFGRLIAWNQFNGSIRDSKVALPVVALTGLSSFHIELRENALAHLGLQHPKALLAAGDFTRAVPVRSRAIFSKLVERYLRAREEQWPWWERSALQFRSHMKGLYAKYHIKPCPMANLILFQREYPRGSVFEVITQLRNMSPVEAAGAIIEHRIPFLIARSELGKKMQDSTLLSTLIDRMSPTELVTNMKSLEKLGVKNNGALRSSLEKSLAKAAGSKANVLKTSVAADAVEDESLKLKLRELQERQLDTIKRKDTGGIDGDWLVLADRSSSMETAIELSRKVAAILSRMVKGTVSLVFFNTSPTFYDVTGKTLEQITEITKHMTATGGTSIGAGLMSAIEKKVPFDGIAIISDGGENTLPWFVPTYKAYCQSTGTLPTLYLYRMGNDANRLFTNCQSADVFLTEFDLRGQVDYYSLPNLVETMRVKRFGLVDTIMETRLLKLSDVLPTKESRVCLTA